MELKEPALNTMLKGHMKYMTARQQVLATNMANIDTPGYKARDLEKLDFASLTEKHRGQLEMRATSAKHLNGTLGPRAFDTPKDRDTFETRPTQNNVVLEDQMAKVSDTGAQFQLSSNMLKKYTQLYRAALGNR